MEKIRAAANSRLTRPAQKMIVAGALLLDRVANSFGSLPRKRLPFPAVIFDGQLKTRQAPGTSFEPYPIPVLADPLDRWQDEKFRD
jgi:hypothetical protein